MATLVPEQLGCFSVRMINKLSYPVLMSFLFPARHAPSVRVIVQKQVVSEAVACREGQQAELSHNSYGEECPQIKLMAGKVTLVNYSACVRKD